MTIRSIRRIAASVVLAGAAVVVLPSLGTSSQVAAATPACTDSWTSTSSGNWNTAADWTTSSGTHVVPKTTAVVCISTPGTYTVTLNTSPTVASLTLGATAGGGQGTQTLLLPSTDATLTLTGAGAGGSTVAPSGVLALGGTTSSGDYSILAGPSATVTNDGTIDVEAGGGGARYLRTNITNEGGGTVDIASAAAASDGSGGATTFTNDGKVDVTAGATYTLSGSSSFANEGGTVTNTGALVQEEGTFTERGGSESGNAVEITDSAKLDDDLSAAPALFFLHGTATLTGTGSTPGVAANQTVSIDAGGTTATLEKSLKNDGTIEVGPGTDTNFSILAGPTYTLTNDGTIETVVGGGGGRYLRTNITNEGGGTVDIESADSYSDGSGGATIFTNDGTVNVTAGASYTLSGSSSFANDGGTIANAGALVQEGGTFTERGGSESGNAVEITDSATLNDATTAAGARFLLHGTTTLTGTGATAGVAANQTVSLDADETTAGLGANLTNDGTIALGAVSGTTFSILAGPTYTLTNDGTIETVVGGGGGRYLRTNIANGSTGTVDVESADSYSDGSGGATIFTNDGTVNVTAGASYTLSGSSSFANDGGTIANAGALVQEGGTFTERGGSESGNAVEITDGATLNDATTAAAARFLLHGTTTLTGTGATAGVAPNQTVSLDATETTANLGASLTNDGTIALGAVSGRTFSILAGPSVTLANDGTIETVVGGGGGRYLRTNITNGPTGTVDIESATTHSDGSGGATTFTNHGTVIFEPTGKFTVSGGSSFVPGANGTLQFDIAGLSTFGTLDSATSVAVAGAADPVPAGYLPSHTTEFDVIEGSHTGAFSTVGDGFSGDYSHTTYVGLVAGLGSTSTGLTSSLNPSTYGQSVTFTATVTGPSGAVTSTGSVTFYDGLTDLGTVSLSGGSAHLSTSALGAGAHRITADYSGGTNYAASISAVVTQTVDQAATTTGLTTTANPSVYGQSVTFTAAVTLQAPGAGSPTGSVTFSDGPTPLATVSLNNGSASYATAALVVGGHEITADYSGDADFTGSDSSTLTQTVGKDVTSTGLDSTVNPSALGQSVTFTADVTVDAPGSGTPTGSVTFYDGPTPLATVTLVTGQASYSTSSLPGGSDSITADYSGGSDFSTSDSGAVVQMVGADPTSTGVSSTNNPSVFGESVAFTADVEVQAPGTGTPTGSVTFYDGTTALATQALTNGSATYTTSSLPAGTDSITATYLGDTGDAASTSPTLHETVGKAATGTGVTSTVNPSVYGQSVTLTANVEVQAPGAGTPTGSVTFYTGTTPLATVGLNDGSASYATAALAVGGHKVTADYGGSSDFTGSDSSTLTQTVGKAATATGLDSTVNPSAAGQSVTFSATVTVQSPGSGTPTGSVTFYDGSISLAKVPLTRGQGSYTTSTLPGGTDSITADYGGGSDFTGSDSGTVLQKVGADPTSTGVTSTKNPSVYGQSVTFTANVEVQAPGTGTPTGSVTFYDGTTALGTVTLTKGSASYTTSSLPGGSDPITAKFLGDTSDAASTSPTLDQTVGPAATSTGLKSSLNPSTSGQSVTFTAHVTGPSGLGTPTGSVTFYDGSTALATTGLSGGSATYTTTALPTGTDSITAKYLGSADFATSTSSKLDETVNPAVTAVGTRTTLASSRNPSTYGESVTFTATVKPASGTGAPTGTVTFKDGATVLGSSGLSGGAAALTTVTLPAGTDSITALYGGTASYLTSTSAPLTQHVNKALPTVDMSPGEAEYGEPTTFTVTLPPASAGAAAPTGSIDLSIPGRPPYRATVPIVAGVATLSTTLPMPPGAYGVAITYGGDANYLPADGTGTLTVLPAATTTTLVSSWNPSDYGQVIAFTATVTPTNGGGHVKFDANGATIPGCGSQPLTERTGSWHATCAPPTLTVGSHEISATYADTAPTYYANSTSATLTQVVSKAPTTTFLNGYSFEGPPLPGSNEVPEAEAVQFTAEVTIDVFPSTAPVPTGTVTFYSNGVAVGTGTLFCTPVDGRCWDHASVLVVVGAGRHVITATYNGSATFLASTTTTPIVVTGVRGT